MPEMTLDQVRVVDTRRTLQVIEDCFQGLPDQVTTYYYNLSFPPVGGEIETVEPDRDLAEKRAWVQRWDDDKLRSLAARNDRLAEADQEE